jgi:hypothetical protein
MLFRKESDKAPPAAMGSAAGAPDAQGTVAAAAPAAGAEPGTQGLGGGRGGGYDSGTSTPRTSAAGLLRIGSLLSRDRSREGAEPAAMMVNLLMDRVTSLEAAVDKLRADAANAATTAANPTDAADYRPSRLSQ